MFVVKFTDCYTAEEGLAEGLCRVKECLSQRQQPATEAYVTATQRSARPSATCEECEDVDEASCVNNRRMQKWSGLLSKKKIVTRDIGDVVDDWQCVIRLSCV